MIGGYLSDMSSSPIKGPVVSLSKKLYSNCLVLVGSRNQLERDLHKPKIACFTITFKLTIIQIELMVHILIKTSWYVLRDNMSSKYLDICALENTVYIVGHSRCSHPFWVRATNITGYNSANNTHTSVL